MAIKLIIIKYSKANVTVINMILIDLGGKSLINSAGFEITPCSELGKSRREITAILLSLSLNVEKFLAWEQAT